MVCVCVTKIKDGVTIMYEYFRALHQRFFREPDYKELHQQIEENRKTLAEKLTPEDRKRLLRMLDAQSSLKNEVSLESFAAGFKLAAGITKELEEDGAYSFDGEVEKQIENSNPEPCYKQRSVL